jgi:hypothetical protein
MAECRLGNWRRLGQWWLGQWRLAERRLAEWRLAKFLAQLVTLVVTCGDPAIH